MLEKETKEQLETTEHELGVVKYENMSLKSMVIALKNRFKNLMKFFSNRIFKSHDKDKYYEFA